jgi:hypothetical protein
MWVLFFDSAAMTYCRQAAETRGCRAATPALVTGDLAKGVHPPGVDAILEVLLL